MISKEKLVNGHVKTRGNQSPVSWIRSSFVTSSIFPFVVFYFQVSKLNKSKAGFPLVESE